MDVVPTATRLTQDASLPFALSTAWPRHADEPSMRTILNRVNMLHDLARETRAQMEALRRDSTQILQAFTARQEAQPARREAAHAAESRTGLQLSFYLFGSFEVRSPEGRVGEWRSRKARSLLAYLAMEPQRRVPKDMLIELFWPDSSVARGSNNLSIAIYQIRSALRELVPPPNHGISVHQGLYSLDPAVDCWIDVQEFERRASQAWQAAAEQQRDAARRHLKDATTLMRGEFLEHDLYEEWTVEPRRSLDASFTRALAWLAADAAELGNWTSLLDYAARMTQRDPCDEEGHRWLMRAQWRLGNRSRALSQFRLCADQLQRELGVSPSNETQRLLMAIRGDESSGSGP